MAKTVLTSLTYLQTNQFNPEVTLNDNLTIIDGLLHISAISITLATPPAATNGDIYILPNSGLTGAWVGHESDIAYYFNGWIFSEPKIGWIAFNKATSGLVYFTGLQWSNLSVASIFSDSAFYVFKNADNTAKTKFDATNLPTGTTTTITLPNSSYNMCKQYLNATVAPTSSDDFADGYTVGSMWINVSTDNIYICADSTVGAAVWKQINNS
jgi:hypothetical protein